MKATIPYHIRTMTSLLFLMSGLIIIPLLLSFTVSMTPDDILKRLGMTKSAAEEKISTGILSGYISSQGVKNIKQLVSGDKKNMVLDLLAYTKKYTGSAAFNSQYQEMRDRNKPALTVLKTPAEFQQETIAGYREQVKKLEESVKKADATLKPVFQQSLDEARKQLGEIEKPDHKMYVNYRKNYEQSQQDVAAANEQELKNWELQYPKDYRLFLKNRLQQFLDETAGIDFEAVTILKNGRHVFVNPEYEQKSKNWKMAWRSGREVVEAARIFVQRWMAELEKNQL